MKTYDFSNFPELTTPNLLLKKLSVNDASTIHQLRKDADVAALTGRTASKGLADAQEFIHKIESIITNHEGVYWSIFLQQNDTMVGTICLWNFDAQHETVEIGFELLPEYQGKGLMQEAVKAVLDFAFEQMQVKVITAAPSAKNPPSIKLLEKTQFKLNTGIHIESDTEVHQPNHDNIEKMLTYILNAEDYKKQTRP